MKSIYSTKRGNEPALEKTGAVGWCDDGQGLREELIFIQPPEKPTGPKEWMPMKAYVAQKAALKKSNIAYYTANPHLLEQKRRKKKGLSDLFGRHRVVPYAGAY